MSIKSNEFSRTNQQNQITQRRARARQCLMCRCRDHATARHRNRQGTGAPPQVSGARQNLRNSGLQHARFNKGSYSLALAVIRASARLAACRARASMLSGTAIRWRIRGIFVAMPGCGTACHARAWCNACASPVARIAGASRMVVLTRRAAIASRSYRMVARRVS